MSVLPEMPRTLIDELLAEQQRLTAVDRFSRQHDAGGPHAQERYYRDLLPLTKPRAEQQYAFAVDLDACTGCKACVSACHSLNGLEEDEIWRNVGVLHGGTSEAPYQQTVTTACHHCLEPACLEGCPVMAYDKDPETGIVRHLDDQCIGCQYCVLKCPYDVPKYSMKRGIVRKCDMCSSRLAVGEAPACVQACPTQAIRIDVIDAAEFERDLRPGEVLVPGAFDSTYTKPTTRFRTSKTTPANAQPADVHVLRLEHAHWPLILMLVFSQTSVGLAVAAAAWSHSGAALMQTTLAVVSCGALHAGLAVSVLHLGRPLGAWRFFLGLRTSWMSREILAFGILATASTALAGCAVAAWVGERFDAASLRAVGQVTTPLASLTALVGLGAVYCSAMIYVDTRRGFWRAGLTFPKFFGTTLLLGATVAGALLSWLGIGDASLAVPARFCLSVAMFIHASLFAWEALGFLQALRNPNCADHRSALTIWTLRRTMSVARATLFGVSTILSVYALTQPGLSAAVAATLACAATLGSQIVERYFYFTAVIAPRMPGGITV